MRPPRGAVKRPSARHRAEREPRAGAAHGGVADDAGGESEERVERAGIVRRKVTSSVPSANATFAKRIRAGRWPHAAQPCAASYGPADSGRWSRKPGPRGTRSVARPFERWSRRESHGSVQIGSIVVYAPRR